jgi:hypothetical protein
LGIACDDRSAGIGFFNKIVTVVREHGCPARRGLIDSSSKGVVFEAISAPWPQS